MDVNGIKREAGGIMWVQGRGRGRGREVGGTMGGKGTSKGSGRNNRGEGKRKRMRD